MNLNATCCAHRLFPKSSAKIIDNWQVIGLRGTGSDSHAVEDRARAAHLLARTTPPSGAKGLAEETTSGMVDAMGFSNVSLGIARGALESFIELARDKIPAARATRCATTT